MMSMREWVQKGIGYDQWVYDGQELERVRVICGLFTTVRADMVDSSRRRTSEWSCESWLWTQLVGVLPAWVWWCERPTEEVSWRAHAPIDPEIGSGLVNRGRDPGLGDWWWFPYWQMIWRQNGYLELSDRAMRKLHIFTDHCLSTLPFATTNLMKTSNENVYKVLFCAWICLC